MLSAQARLTGLALGTVQLGMDYGIANRRGRPSGDDAQAMLRAAYRGGIRLLDTAQSYGASEDLIGRHHERHPEERFQVVSKLAAGVDVRDEGAVVEAVRGSVGRSRAALAAMLLHDPAHLDEWDGALGRAMRACVAEGLIEQAGVSIYSTAEFEKALSLPDIGVIQAPLNALDRRLVSSGLLRRALSMGKTVLLRSVYLQGLLLLESLPSSVSFASEALGRWRDVCARHGLSPATAAMKYALSAAPGCALVIGCESLEQIERNIEFALEPGLSQGVIEDIESLPTPEARVLDPRLWPRD